MSPAGKMFRIWVDNWHSAEAAGMGGKQT